ncbi:MAG: diguanylate cyclase, partial [Desulfofustis sp.]|nr:diguanylate cyclase [Desulfofustis sp.]
MSTMTEKPELTTLTSSLDELSQVMLELHQLKRQSERLDQMNRLHARLAGVLSVPGMIEAYSVWLMPVVEHELIGYNNSARGKKHLFCSGHGPNRRRAIAFAEKLIEDGATPRQAVKSDDGQFGHKWIFETVDDAGILLILKEGRELDDGEMAIINDSLTILAESLQRGLEYEDLFERASSDPLTGLSNRRVFDRRISSMMDSATRYNHPLTMLSLDLDHFKDINDNLGHQVGDEVLKSVAGVLAAAVRSTDLLVRMGGDEFLLVLDNTNCQQGRILAERLVKKIDELDVRANDSVKLGVSIGLAQMEPGESLRTWLERTDDIL